MFLLSFFFFCPTMIRFSFEEKKLMAAVMGVRGDSRVTVE